jgi:glycosyltransferase involved in cell wall biosynthesis
VDSVRNQTYENQEIVVVDDCPDDHPVRAEVAAYMATVEDPRVRYSQNEKNLGGSLCRNRGIELATGDYITFLDDDDEYMPEKVESQLAFMLEHGYDLSLTKLCIYTSDGKLVDYRDFGDVPAFDNETLLKYHLMKHLTGTPTFMFKAEKLRQIGGFEPALMGQEFYLMFKAIEQGLTIGYFPQCHVKAYRHEGEAISTGRNKIKGEMIMYDFKKRYFDRLTAGERRVVRFRHYAVLSVAYKRNRMYFKMLGAGFAAIFSAPLVFVKEIFKFAKKIFRHR